MTPVPSAPGAIALPAVASVPPVPAALTAAAAILVVVLARRAGHPRRAVPGVLGVLALGVALGSGLEDQATRMLSAHMVQHLLLQSVAAPLLVVSAPASTLLAVLPRTPARRLARGMRRPAVRRLTHPLPAAVAFSLTLALVHLPIVYEGALRHPLVHDLEHAALFWSSAWLWATVLRTDPLPRAAGVVARVAALLLAMAAMSVVGMVLGTLADVAYPSYAAAIGTGHALADQGRAGALMWIGGTVVGLPLLLLLASRALADEERRAIVRAAHADRVVPATGERR